MLLFARLRDFVWNGNTERLRLPWRLLVWLGLLVGLGFLAQFLIVHWHPKFTINSQIRLVALYSDRWQSLVVPSLAIL